VFAGTVAIKPGRALRHTELQLFAYRYDDDRDVRARPDNTGRAAPVVDVGITSFGGALVGSYPGQAGQWDALLWGAGQTGHWFEQPHRAYSVAAEAGYQWTSAAGRPWVRAGVLRASGDDDPADDRHATFFQMLPTVRRYSLTATYSQMNLSDVFAQVMVRPADTVNIRADVHRLSLATARDRWYYGSGATQESGTLFGYAVRPSNGASRLGHVFETSADYAAHKHLSVNGYAGAFRGGDVVRRAFEGRWLVFAYLETVVQF
jgi:hypothetical protein